MNILTQIKHEVRGQMRQSVLIDLVDHAKKQITKPRSRSFIDSNKRSKRKPLAALLLKP